MKIEFAARADIGVRETNDDRVLVGGRVLNMTSHNGSTDLPALAAVCDGCGGYLGGNIAAQTVVDLLSNEDPNELADPQYLAAVLENCRQAVLKKKEEMPQFSQMCTTVAGCIFLESGTVFFHAGDSRIYRIDKWGVAPMTRDHSLVQDLVDQGEIAPEEAATHPKRNVISRCIGIPCPPPEIYVSRTALQPGEVFLLCSDGLWEHIGEEEIQEWLDRDLPLSAIADGMVRTALQKGSDDNTSVCICRGTEENSETAFEPTKTEAAEIPEDSPAEAPADEPDKQI